MVVVLVIVVFVFIDRGTYVGVRMRRGSGVHVDL
jgi:hypothetical protein